MFIPVQLISFNILAGCERLPKIKREPDSPGNSDSAKAWFFSGNAEPQLGIFRQNNMLHNMLRGCAELGLGVPGAWNILYFHEQIPYLSFRGNREREYRMSNKEYRMSK